MTQQELLKEMAERAGTTQAQAAAMIAALGEIVGEMLRIGESVNHVALGKFSPKIRAASKGRNPRTGAEIEIEQKRQAKFNPSRALREALNQKLPTSDATRYQAGWSCGG